MKDTIIDWEGNKLTISTECTVQYWSVEVEKIALTRCCTSAKLSVLGQGHILRQTCFSHC